MKFTVIHPATYMVYYLILILFAFFFNDPYYLASFLICIILLITFQGINSEFKNIIKFYIPMAFLIIILNPLVSHIGVTKIYIIGSYFITLEALVYGILMSLSLLIILLLFASYNNTVSYQEMLYILSKRFPNISIIIIMALRFIPLLNYRLSEVNKVFRLNHESSAKNNETKINKIKDTAQMLAVVVSWSLEESMLAAKSMKGRGYGITERTNYLSFKFRKIDYYFISIIIISAVVCITGLLQGHGRINIYPQLQFSFSENIFNIFYFSFLILLLPLVYLEFKEKLIWH
ncbi:cobalt ABC transporter permease [Methanobacterium sp. A39]|uniref:Cobalt ABC transporter permease n=2 Tax=Methanobacteriaceae TaxID=2159 RepID=A0A2A2HA62_METBR|nr:MULTISPECIES: energy-coupling factor transporter transmembrane component T [Methanobacterium]OEC88523.1 cobalt ABC transporter permease [Methanobacterium sp. A39]PAV06322.1 cobalt ABC transporter permease [Methanobacterium bryantii]